MRIVVDLDGTICELKQENQSYSDVLPLPGAAETLRAWKEEGHTIIIHTARNMRTAGGNIGIAVANIGKTTLDWLEQYRIPYDEIVFGKPQGDLYIDDLGHRFQSWNLARNAIF
ncbi:HAD hydrolase family protein [Cohnella soli]|uniref:HAD hydrolase family protein n=1 Tax=Cohnella soli TaxID=425005 RepID=A0ABW0I3T7_9BACL